MGVATCNAAVRLGAAVIVVLCLLVMVSDAQAQPPFQQTGKVRVIDGDTLVMGEVRHRLAFIDAPELKQHCLNRHGKRYACGQVARDKLTNLVEGREVTCTWQKTGRYARPISVCTFIRRGRTIVINHWMLQWGWAVMYGDGSAELQALEAKAKAAKRGLWQGLFRLPWRWRKGELNVT